MLDNWYIMLEVLKHRDTGFLKILQNAHYLFLNIFYSNGASWGIDKLIPNLLCQGGDSVNNCVFFYLFV